MSRKSYRSGRSPGLLGLTGNRFVDSLAAAKWTRVTAGREPLINALSVKEMFALVEPPYLLVDFVVAKAHETTLATCDGDLLDALERYCNDRACTFSYLVDTRR